jgi:uncharacterized membrane protein
VFVGGTLSPGQVRFGKRHNARVLELLFGLIVAVGVLLLALVLPILSFVRAQAARRIASDLQGRVIALETEVAQLRGTAAPSPSQYTAAPAVPDVHVSRPDTAAVPSPAPAFEPSVPRYPPLEPLPAPVPVKEDLEQQIGSRWLLYAGIAAVVLGMSYFIKFAFDNGWISEPLRVLSGVLIGIGLIAAGVRFSSRGLGLFGQALAGGGVVVLYVSVYSALHFYQLISEAPAFALMTVVTAVAAWLADRQRAQPLAALALLGGFATPLLVGGERGAQVVLFTYIAILIGGAATLARRHTWPLLSGASYVCTILLVVSWFFSAYDPAHWLRTELFLTLYVGLFGYLLWTLLASRQRSAQTQLAIAILTTAPLAYHLASIILLNDQPAAWLLYLVLATIAGLAISQRAQAPWMRVLVLLLIGIPALAWLGVLEYPRWDVAAIGTMFVLYGLHLVAQWEAADESVDDRPLPLAETAHTQLNGLLLPLALYVFLADRAAAWTPGIIAALSVWNAGLAAIARTRAPRMSLQFIAVSATLAACAIVLQFDGPVVAVGWAAEGVVLGWLAMRERSRVIGLGSGTLLVLGSMQVVGELTKPLPGGEAAFVNPRALAAVLVIGLLAWLAWRMGDDADAEVSRRARDTVIVAANLLAVLFLSSEIHAFFVGRAVDATIEGAGIVAASANLAEQLTLSVTWAFYAVVLIALGIRRRYAPARYFAIALFGLTVAKVLMNDIAGLDRFYRMLTVLAVGVLLLVASYLYQRRNEADALE